MDILLIVVAVLLSVLRAAGVTHQIFQAAAHLFVGGLLGAYAVGHRRFYLYMALTLSVVEIVCFLLMKHRVI